MRIFYFIYHRLIVVTAFILLLTGTVHAQNNNNNREKVESMRIAFITERLSLTPQEAKQFWPVYNSYRKDLTQLRRSFYPGDDGRDSHLDADRQLDFEQKRLDLRRHYKSEFEQAIGREKVNKLVNAEEDFKRLLIQTMRNRRQQRPGGRW